MSKCASRKRAAMRIEQYCKRRKDRMKPKRQEDSSCVFAYRFCRGTCQRRDTAGKESAPKSIRRRSRKKHCKSRQDDTAGKSSRERQAPAPVCRSQSAAPAIRVSRIPRSVAGRITGHRRSLPQPSSAAWCPRLLTRAEVKDLHTAAY